MKGTAIYPVPFVQNDGITLTISFNEKVITEADGEKTYEYDTAMLDVTNDLEVVYDAILSQCDVTGLEARKIARKALGIELTLDDAIADKVAKLMAYDDSDAVNEFTLGGVPMWVKLDERQKMKQSLDVLDDDEIWTYWYNLIPITYPVSVFRDMLRKVERYAILCKNNTFLHEKNIRELTTIAEVDAYDFTTGYPDKLEF